MHFLNLKMTAENPETEPVSAPVEAQEVYSQGISKSRARASFVVRRQSSGSVRSYKRQTAKCCLFLSRRVGVRWVPRTTAENRGFQTAALFWRMDQEWRRMEGRK